MLYSFPAVGLPLEDLLKTAEEQRLTTALDLRSDMTAGRIDIVQGEIVDAVFGGLQGEEAVYAALRCDSLHVNPGRTPKGSAARRIRLSTSEILSRSTQRKS
jgi:hypothetical protein